ncbi:MAG: ammonium transporter [Planctomycetota bacterium]|nr:ammonium transporter [Planctomycetota bacterium]MDA1177936.1 ammonium transporter [Planctomycetota bacterium]
MDTRRVVMGGMVSLCLLWPASVMRADDSNQGEATVTAEVSAGDNAWMMVSSALVLFMTAPGLAMFYSGLVRRKNVLGVIMQCLFLMGIMSIVWSLWGYSLAFGGDGNVRPWIGNGEHLFLHSIQLNKGIGPIYTGLSIPELTFMLFQGMFFIITPALICGAFAERMKFSTMVVFSVLWGTLVYCPLCHWVWDGGFLAYGSKNAIQGGALDFAGGTVVHISSGVSALICAIVMGRRLGYGTEDMRPHNLTYTTLGAAMLWVGWFGFNAGSAGAANFLATNAMVVTHLSASSGAVAWAFMEWVLRGKPSVLGTASGAVAGLVCITPASGYVQPMPALVMGLLAGIVCYFACSSLKSTFRYDDSLDAFGVHGVGGTLGALLTGVFATTAVNPLAADGLFYNQDTGGQLLAGQATAAGITIAFAAVASFILLKILDATMGLRVSQQGELQGLDLSEHGEEGYILN